MYPVDKKRLCGISFPYNKKYPYTKFFKSIGLAGKPHLGVDIAPYYQYKDDTFLIIAPVKGEVVYAGNNKAMGNMIAILFTEGDIQMLHILCHLSSIKSDVKKGVGVEKGSTLGVMGSTGNSTATHLHYQVEIPGNNPTPTHWWIEGNWQTIDPKKFLT